MLVQDRLLEVQDGSLVKFEYRGIPGQAKPEGAAVKSGGRQYYLPASVCHRMPASVTEARNNDASGSSNSFAASRDSCARLYAVSSAVQPTPTGMRVIFPFSGR
jgi:hypothetical protein